MRLDRMTGLQDRQDDDQVTICIDILSPASLPILSSCQLSAVTTTAAAWPVVL